MSLSLAPSSWASLGRPTGAASTSLPPPGAGPPALSGAARSAPAPYSSFGGGAAEFGPTFDLKMLEKGALLKSCVRQIRRTNRRHRPDDDQRSSRELRVDGGRNLVDLLSSRQYSPNANPANPFYHYEGTNRLGKLYCRSGYHLQIHNDGKVNGTRQENSRFGVLEFLSVAFGLVSIKGKESNQYLCMNKRGRLYGSEKHSEECIFMEKMLENYYNTYTSCKYGRGRHSKKKWYVALNKRGRPKRGNQSRKKQKFTQFLVLHMDDQEYRWTRRKFIFSNRDSYFGINSFTQEWRRRQSPWGRVRTMQHHRSMSSSSVFNIPLADGGSTTPATADRNRDRTRGRLREMRIADSR